MRLETLKLTARDLARARAFYNGKLGFRVVEENLDRSFVIDAGGVRLHIDKDGARSPLAQAEPRLFFHTAEVAARCLALRDLGVSVDGPRQTPDGVIAELSDPDGHPITLFER